MPEIIAIDELAEAPHAEVFEERRPRTVRLELDAGDEVPPHTHPGTNVVLYLLDGRLDLALDGETHELEPGDVARFSGEREISPRAVEASTALIVFAPTTGGS
ncbi:MULTISPECIES: cupin domain-containing protein [Halolamina]|uniref:Cupin domain-containing protein n=1 Tax=Halolamina pelagica TaxID=699431 RepID=A0A1I5MUK1_9EURY|nr:MULTISPECIES: cupin domain-containing protein [Halolamina]NHX36167.1 cupin domain-containing protein [Halolamina sp. R1-12]SFP13262.1 Cupin domain-containing protein [Halolamina pelagica]